MNTPLFIKSLERQALAAIESGDPADEQLFSRATGLLPAAFQTQLQVLGAEQLALDIAAHAEQAKVPAEPLDFSQFQATRSETSNLAEVTTVQEDEGVEGILYAGGCFIYKQAPSEGARYRLQIGRDEFESNDLPHLERVLYEQWYVRECAPGPLGGEPKLEGVLQEPGASMRDGPEI